MENDLSLMKNDSSFHTNYLKKTLLEVFKKAVQSFPDRIAIVCKRRRISYEDLDKKSSQLALYLRDLNITPGQVVGVCFERSIEYILVIIALIKIGAIYTPINPKDPLNRVQSIIANAEINFLIVDKLTVEEKALHGIHTIVFKDIILPKFDNIRKTDHETKPEDTVCLIHTSGTTGEPKAVAITHVGIVRLVKNTNYIQFEIVDRVAHVSPLAFDAAHFEIWGSLLNGSTLVVIDDKIVLSPQLFSKALLDLRISILFLTTAFFNFLVTESPKGFSKLKYLLFGGEKVNVDIVRKLLEHHEKPTYLIHCYGPTECSTFATTYLISQLSPDDTDIPIGFPIINTEVYVLNEQLEIVSPDNIGEIYIGGPGVANGYYNQPILTEMAFHKNYLNPESIYKLYRTGDLGRYCLDGAIEYVGRSDKQVKVRGFRIELSAIELICRSFPAIKQAIVTTEDNFSKSLDIIAYLYTDKKNISYKKLLNSLKQRLPYYMIPHRFFIVDSIPLTVNGKINFQKLSGMKLIELKNKMRSLQPTTDIEKKIVGLFQAILNRNEISMLDPIWDLGMDSLKAMQLTAKLMSLYDVKLTVTDINQIEHLRDLARLIETLPKNFHHYPPAKKNLIQSNILPISPTQQGMWFIYKMEPNNNHYNESLIYQITGKLDLGYLEKCLNQLIKKHIALRISFMFDEDEPCQKINLQHEIKIEKHDIQFLNGDKLKDAWISKVESIVARPFDLEKLPPYVIHALQISSQEWILVFNFHHIIVDGWSLYLFMNELSALYNNEISMFPETSYAYHDYIDWYWRLLKTELIETQLHYWQSKLMGSQSKVLFPAKKYFSEVMEVGKTEIFFINAELMTELQLVAVREKTTLFSLLLSAFLLMLHRISKQTDICVGVPVANRRLPEFENIIGCMVNTIVVRSVISYTFSIKDFIKEITKQLLNDYNNQDIPYDYVVHALNPARDIDIAGLFNCLFVFQNTPQPVLDLNHLNIKEIQLKQKTSKFDLMLSIQEKNGSLQALFEYKTGKIHGETIEQLKNDYQYLLLSIGKHINKKLSELNDTYFDGYVLSSALETVLPYKDTLINLKDQFERQVLKSENNIAVIFNTEFLSYQLINRKSNQLANYLINQNISKEKAVGIYMDRSISMIVSLLALTKLGVPCVSLDPSYPLSHLKQICSESKIKQLLTEKSLLNQPFLEGNKLNVHCIDELDLSCFSSENPKTNVSLKDILYIIFTSGSTGKPKGIRVTHHTLANLLNWENNQIVFEHTPTTLQFSSLNFDMSFQEIFATLCFGGQLILIPEIVRRDNVSFLNYLNEFQIERIYLPFAKLQSLAETAENLSFYPSTLKLIVSTGEQLYCTPVIKNFFIKSKQPIFYNFYGPSETHVVSYYRLSGSPKNWEEIPPIGYPIDQIRFYILNKHNEEAKEGELGEIGVGGFLIKPCYINHPSLNQERFVKLNLNNESQWIYKTGDLGKFREDGVLVYCGRNDLQVKINGYRIEIEQIETCLLSHPIIANAAIVCPSHQETKQLLAYIVLKNNVLFSEEEIMQYLKQRLPHYMVVSNFIVKEKLPTTASGKLDRQALHLLSNHYYQLTENEPFSSDAIEYKIIEIFKSALNLSKISIDKNFFDLGAHSLMLAKIQIKISKMFNKHLPLVEFFHHPTIRLLTAHLKRSFSKKNINVLSQVSQPATENLQSEIAIIGMTGKFPGADTIEEFWQLTVEQTETVTFLKNVDNPCKDSKIHFVPAASVMSNIYKFDADYFGITSQEAKVMDPQQRHFLMGAVHALESAGYDPFRFNGKIGVVASAGENTYYRLILNSSLDTSNILDNFQLALAHEKDFLATKASYYLNLHGPSFTLQSACSSSLVAIHMSTHLLREEECDLVIAGGILIDPIQQEGYTYKEGHIFSPDGHCRPFDAEAAGTYGASGYGLVVLKKLTCALEDKDTIYAVIRGSAVNNDGNRKAGYAAPSHLGQIDVIQAAHRKATIHPEQISYIEAHGTGTPLGDPIEISALTAAFHEKTDKKGFCAIASLKSQIGHLGAAAGAAGLIRTALALFYQRIPSSLHYQQANSAIDFLMSPFYVNTKVQDWPLMSGRYAAVSSFGIGGTNAHMVLSQAPSMHDSSSQLCKSHLLILSAKTLAALREQCIQLAEYLQKNPDISLHKVAYTLQVGRTEHVYRTAFICRENMEASIKLKQRACYLESFPEKYSSAPIIDEEEIKEYEDSSLLSLGKLWQAGGSVNWEGLYKETCPGRIPLPLYPFDLSQDYNMLKTIDIAENPTKKEDILNWFYTVKWQPLQVSAEQSVRPGVGHAYLLLMDSFGLGNRIKQLLTTSGAHVISVYPAERFSCSLNEDIYYLNIESEKDYERLLSQVSKVFSQITLLYLLPLYPGNKQVTLFNIEAAENSVFYGLLYFMRAYDAIYTNNSLKIMIITNNTFEVIGSEKLRPESALLLGPCTVIPQEYPYAKTYYIDLFLPEKRSITEGIAKEIMRLLLMNHYQDSIIAYRNEQLWVRKLAAISDVNKSANGIIIKENSVYLITGGLGGIGLTLAHAISKQAKVHLILTSRNFFPPQVEWESYLEQSKSKAVCMQIKKLQACLNNGATVDIVQADITNETNVKKLIGMILKKYKQLNGVIHCAGYPGGGVIGLKTKDAVKKVFSPKVYGTLLLSDMLKNINLEFFVNCSSLAAWLGGAGQVDYCSANNFLDTFTYYQQKINKNTLYLSINWDTWQQVGMAANSMLPFDLQKIHDQELVQGLSDSEGESIFLRALSYQKQVLISKTILTDRQAISLTIRENKKNASDSIKFSLAEIEKKVTAIFYKYLGIHLLPDESFFENGGHSLMSIEVVMELNQVFAQKISLAEFIQHDTAQQLAIYIKKYTPSFEKSLVALKLSNSEHKLFIVHPIGGDIVAYEGIARYLNKDCSVYALQDPILYDAPELISCIKEKAAHYVYLITQIQTEEPYNIAGWSFGALVAYEMAVILEKQGKKVRRIILIDPPFPNQIDQWPAITDPDQTINAALLKEFGMRYQLPATINFIDTMHISEEQQIAKITELLPMSLNNELKVYFEKILKACRTNIAAMIQYAVSTPVDAALVLYQAEKNIRPSLKEQWQPYTRSTLAHYLLDGDHYSILKPPLVEQWTTHLATILMSEES